MVEPTREESLQGAWRLAQERAVRVIELEAQVRSLEEQLETLYAAADEAAQTLHQDEHVGAIFRLSAALQKFDSNPARERLVELSTSEGGIDREALGRAWTGEEQSPASVPEDLAENLERSKRYAEEQGGVWTFDASNQDRDPASEPKT